MTKHTILFLAANPLGTDRLALDQEARAIQVAIERSGHRDRFELVTRWAVQPLDLLDELRKLKPTVVHFSGHGGHGEPGKPRPNEAPRRDIVGELGSFDSNHQHGLFFQGPDDRPQLVSTAALEETFSAAGSLVKLVVLNACYTGVQAEALLRHVNCVVGMGGSIRDDAARNFAIGFYGGLGECESVASAFQQGRAAISLEGLPNSERPQLKVRDGIDADRLILAEIRPESASAGNTADSSGEATGNETELQRRGWTWYSSVESVEAGLVSVLAIVETIAASAMYAWIAWRFGTLHLAISACAAPFLLLRTQRSVSLALHWFHSIFKPKPNEDSFWRNDPSFRPSMPFWELYNNIFIIIIVAPLFVTPAFLVLCAAPVISIRAVATTITVVTQPLRSISEIPRNWWRSIACVDSCCPLELLHGAYQRYGSGVYETKTHLALMPWSGLEKLAAGGAGVGAGQLVLLYVCVFSIGMVVLLPALFYRWSLKGAALIYSPLIWIVRGAMARPLRIHLQDVARLAYYRIPRWFALFVLTLLAVKVYIYSAWSDFAPSWRTIPGHRLLDAVVMPEAFPPWQIASVINAILAWALYLVADWAVARWDRGPWINEKLIEVTLRWLALVRGVLSVYTIACGIYLAASLSGRFDLPPMGTCILPWL